MVYPSRSRSHRCPICPGNSCNPASQSRLNNVPTWDSCASMVHRYAIELAIGFLCQRGCRPLQGNAFFGMYSLLHFMRRKGKITCRPRLHRPPLHCGLSALYCHSPPDNSGVHAACQKHRGLCQCQQFCRVHHSQNSTKSALNHMLAIASPSGTGFATTRLTTAARG